MDIQQIEMRNLRIEDYQQLKSSMIEAYEQMPEYYWRENHIKILLDKFPDGQICVLVNGKIAGSALSIIVDYNKFGDEHTYEQITGNYTFNTHDPNGDVLYGIEIFIHPDYRGLRLGRRLYEGRKQICENLNLRAIVAGGRIPNYSNYAHELSPKEYIQKVKLTEIHDPVLHFQLSNDFHVRKVLKNYLKGDKESMEFATLLAWNNIYYTQSEKLINNPKSVVRLGLVQWQMRTFNNLDSLYEQIEFFVDAVSDYKSDFILFPEFFNAPLMSIYNHLKESEAVRELAQYTEQLRDKFIEFAISYNVNIITGSMPYMIDEKLYNVGYLCRRNGTWEQYEKIHITPNELSYWGLSGGNKLKVFETDAGKIGVQICYDIEFPELSRIMSDQGVQLIFVPFLTDTQNGYTRVRRCAQARAIENECYVAIAGSVGNLPKVNNMDIQYAQSAVFTPSDFAFPTNGVKAEATPNTEMTLIVDVDLDLLKELHSHGAVTNLRNRRLDFYNLFLTDKESSR
ncbi:MAG: carbon-nitrogen hydrolase [Bacteroidetes bacterium HGW-Bacteroidetes-4]|nr:MAG: carbon-nitrogen hydrolase [Bacteroidetes bacterium HGW-Bacteroidetes-4]